MFPPLNRYRLNRQSFISKYSKPAGEDFPRVVCFRCFRCVRHSLLQRVQIIGKDFYARLRNSQIITLCDLAACVPHLIAKYVCRRIHFREACAVSVAEMMELEVYSKSGLTPTLVQSFTDFGAEVYRSFTDFGIDSHMTYSLFAIFVLL